MDTILQQGGHNCGPIAYMVGWASINSDIKIDMENMHVEKYIEILINRYKQLLNKYQSLLAFDIEEKTNMADSQEIVNLVNECIICMNDIESEISMANKMACDHHKHFHQNCILSWSHCSQHCAIFKEMLPKECLGIIDDNIE